MIGLDSIFALIVVLFSAIIHEVAHGYAALWQGDVTAKYEGRLTLNPLVHLEWFGSIILPALLFLFNSPFLFGWAKPIPFNPYNFKNQRWGEAIVAFAGPLSNIALVLIFSLIIRVGGGFLPDSALYLMSIIVLINIVLALFNLLPIPPLDGSKILFAFLPERYTPMLRMLEQYSFIFVILFLLFGWSLVTPIIYGLFSIFTGVLV